MRSAKTEREFKRGADALRITAELRVRAKATDDLGKARLLTSMDVIGGGSKGPYTLVVSRLSRKQLMRVIEAVAASEAKPEV